jgi:hypothetical protein
VERAADEGGVPPECAGDEGGRARRAGHHWSARQPPAGPVLCSVAREEKRGRKKREEGEKNEPFCM